MSTKLSEAQQKALDWFRANPGWYSSYRSRFGRNTLDALHARGLLERHMGLGSMAFPATSIEYRAKANLLSWDKKTRSMANQIDEIARAAIASVEGK